MFGNALGSSLAENDWSGGSSNASAQDLSPGTAPISIPDVNPEITALPMPTSDQWAALASSIDLGTGAAASGGAQAFETGPALNGYNGAATIAGIESLQTPNVDLGALSGSGNFEVNQGFINGASPYGEDFQNLSTGPMRVSRASGGSSFSLLNLLGISTAYAETDDADTSLVTSLPEPNPPLEENIAKLDLEVKEAQRDPSLEVDRPDEWFLAQMRALPSSAPTVAQVFPSSVDSAIEAETGPSPESVLGSPTRVGEYGPELVTPPASSAAAVPQAGSGPLDPFFGADRAIDTLTAAPDNVPVWKSPNPLSPVQQVDAFGNEIYYRTMSPEQYEILMETGQLPPTTETSISPVLSYSSKYNGITVQFATAPGTSEQLQEFGIAANPPAEDQLPDLSTQTGPWMQTNVRFKVEGGQMTTQLGQGPGINIFNQNIIDFQQVK